VLQALRPALDATCQKSMSFKPWASQAKPLCMIYLLAEGELVSQALGV